MTITALTAVTRTATDAFELEIDRSSWIIRGPNGGYLAAVVLRSLIERVADLADGDPTARAPRSLTMHYPSAPTEGPATIVTEVVRAGRSLVSARAELRQDGRTHCLALAAFSPPWPGPDWADAPAPVVPPFAELPPDVPRDPAAPRLPFMKHWEHRSCLGPPLFSGGDRAEVGGWIRPVVAEPLDPCILAAMTDAWPPSIFSRLTTPAVAPTIDLTIHFRHPVPVATMAPTDAVLSRLTSATADEGIFEEDGCFWSPDGTLLAQSRQLALVMPAP